MTTNTTIRHLLVSLLVLMVLVPSSVRANEISAEATLQVASEPLGLSVGVGAFGYWRHLLDWQYNLCVVHDPEAIKGCDMGMPRSHPVDAFTQLCGDHWLYNCRNQFPWSDNTCLDCNGACKDTRIWDYSRDVTITLLTSNPEGMRNAIEENKQRTTDKHCEETNSVDTTYVFGAYYEVISLGLNALPGSDWDKYDDFGFDSGFLTKAGQIGVGSASGTRQEVSTAAWFKRLEVLGALVNDQAITAALATLEITPMALAADMAIDPKEVNLAQYVDPYTARALGLVAWWVAYQFEPENVRPTDMGAPSDEPTVEIWEQIHGIWESTCDDPFFGDCDGPAAFVSEVQLVGNELTFWVESEYQMVGYRVEGAYNADDKANWTDLGILIPPQLGARVVTLPSSPYSHFRLVGFDLRGPIYHSVVQRQAEAIQRYLPVSRSEAYWNGQLETLRQEKEAAQQATVISDHKTRMYCPVEWLDIVEGWFVPSAMDAGWTVMPTFTYSLGTDPNVVRANIHAQIVTDEANGVFFPVKMGKSNDHEVWTNLSWWPDLPGTEDDWAGIRSDFVSGGFPDLGQPELDINPSHWMPRPRPRDVGMTSITPYFNTEFPDEDLDGDGMPDVLVSRVPARSRQQLLEYANKMLWQSFGPQVIGTPRVLMMVGNRDYDNPNDGQLAMDAADVSLGLMTATSNETLLESEFPVDATRVAQLPVLWSNADIAWMISSQSGRHFTGDMMVRPYFNVTQLEQGHHPTLVALTCFGGTSAMTEHPVSGMPVVEEILMDPWSGPAQVIGGGFGTWQTGNSLLSQHMAERLNSSVGNPILPSIVYQEARLASLVETGVDPFVRESIESTLFLGVPWLTLRDKAVQVAVAETKTEFRLAMKPISPNPMRSQSTMTFTLPETGPVKVQVFDVTGRLVRTLVDRQMTEGQAHVTWDGTNDVGVHVATGIYNYRLQADRKALTQKIVLLR